MSSRSLLVKEVLDEYGALTRVALQTFLKAQSERSDVYRMAADYPLRTTDVRCARVFASPPPKRLELLPNRRCSRPFRWNCCTTPS